MSAARRPTATLAAPTPLAPPYRYSIREITAEEHVFKVNRFSPSVWDVRRFASGSLHMLSLQSRASDRTYCDAVSLGGQCFMMVTSRMDLFERGKAFIDFHGMRVINVLIDGTYAVWDGEGREHTLRGGQMLAFDSSSHEPCRRSYPSARPITALLFAASRSGWRDQAMELGIADAAERGLFSGPSLTSAVGAAPRSFLAIAKDMLSLAGPLDARAFRYRTLVGELLMLWTPGSAAQRAAPSGIETLSAKATAIARICAIIRSAPDQEHSLSEFARAVGMSRSALTAGFREQTGLSIGAYRHRVRMELAAALIGQGLRPLSAVAYRVGYAEPASFTRAFHEHFGRSPRDWATST